MDELEKWMDMIMFDYEESIKDGDFISIEKEDEL